MLKVKCVIEDNDGGGGGREKGKEKKKTKTEKEDWRLMRTFFPQMCNSKL